MEIIRYSQSDMRHFSNKPRRPGKNWPAVRARIAAIAAFEVGDSTPVASPADGYTVQALNATNITKLWRMISVTGVQKIIRVI